MKEAVGLFANLPHDGIGIHGTNLFNAKKVSIEGLQTQYSKDGKIHFIHIPTTSYNSFMKGKATLLKLLDHPVNTYAFLSRVNKLQTESPDKSIPAVVIFKSFKGSKNNPIYGDLPDELETYPMWGETTNDIPKDHIMGYIALEEKHPRITYRAIRNFLVKTLMEGS